MAKLPTYTASLGGLPEVGGRRATAADFGAASGGLAEGLTHFAAKTYANTEDKEARDSLVRTSQINAKYAKALNEAATSGGDLEEIRRAMNDELSAVGDDFVTPKGRDQLTVYSANLNRSFEEQADSVRVRRAGVEAKTAATQFVNSESELVIANPALLAQSEQRIDEFVSLLPNVAPEMQKALGIELKSQLTMTAVQASIRLDAPVVLAKLENGAWDMTPEQRERAIEDSKQQIRANAVGEQHSAAMAEKAEKARIAKVNDDLTGLYAEGKLTVSQVREAGLPATGEGGQLMWLDRLKQQTRDVTDGPAATDPAVFNSLRARIDLPAGDKNRITSSDAVWARYGRGLSDTNAKWLEKRMQDNSTPSGQRWTTAEAEAIRNLSKSLDRSTMFAMDQGGGMRVQAFTMHLREKADRYRKEGKDEYLLLNPNAPDYIGNDIPMFMTSAQKMTKKMVDDFDEAFADTVPKETPAVPKTAPGKPWMPPDITKPVTPFRVVPDDPVKAPVKTKPVTPFRVVPDDPVKAPVKTKRNQPIEPPIIKPVKPEAPIERKPLGEIFKKK